MAGISSPLLHHVSMNLLVSSMEQFKVPIFSMDIRMGCHDVNGFRAQGAAASTVPKKLPEVHLNSDSPLILKVVASCNLGRTRLLVEPLDGGSADLPALFALVSLNQEMVTAANKPSFLYLHRHRLQGSNPPLGVGKNPMKILLGQDNNRMRISKFREVMQQSKARTLERIEKSRQQWRIYKFYFKRYQNGAALDCYFRAALVDKKLHPEKALKSIERIASMSERHMQTVLSTSVLTPLLALFEDDKSTRNLLNLASHTLTILFRGELSLYQVNSALPTVRKLILLDTVGDAAKLCLDGLLALTYLTYGPNEYIQAILEADICQRLIIIMSLPGTRFVELALGIVYHLCLVDFQVPLENQLLPALHNVLTNQRAENILMDVCWVLWMLIDAEFIPHLLNILKRDDVYDADLQSLVVDVILYAIENGSVEQIKSLVNQGCLTEFFKFMDCACEDTRYLCLDGIRKILEMGHDNRVDGVNEFALIFDQLGGFDTMDELLDDLHQETRELARLILDSFDPQN
ncbi:hypothetical protein Ancab_038199 [Ancistrocladus abbreviatus]